MKKCLVSRCESAGVIVVETPRPGVFKVCEHHADLISTSPGDWSVDLSRDGVWSINPIPAQQK